MRRGAARYRSSLKRRARQRRARCAPRSTVAVNDPSGRAVARRSHDHPRRRPAGILIGIKPLFRPGHRRGRRRPGSKSRPYRPRRGPRGHARARLRLVRERPDWRMVDARGSLARYETVWKDEPLETADVAIPGDPAPCAYAQAGWTSDATGSRSTETRRTRRHVRAVPRRVGRVRQSGHAGQGGRLDRPPEAAWGGRARRVSTWRPPLPGRRPSSWRSATGCMACATVDVPAGRDGPRYSRGGRLGARAPMSPCTCSGVPKAAGAVIAAGRHARSALAWIGIDPAARTLPMAIAAPERTAPARPASPLAGPHGTRRLGQRRRGRRGRAAADELRDSPDPVQALPGPPPPRVSTSATIGAG